MTDINCNHPVQASEDEEIDHPLQLTDDELEKQFPSKALAFRIGNAVGRSDANARAAVALRRVAVEMLRMVAILERNIELDAAIVTNDPEPKTH